MANNLETLLEIYASEIQALETAAFQVLDDRWLDSAVGTQLDNLGQIIGRDRLGEDDDTYRILLTSQIALNSSSGTVSEILYVLNLNVPTITLELEQLYPAAFVITAESDPITTSTATIISGLIDRLRAGGVRAYFTYYIADPLFKLDGADSSVFDGTYLFAATLEG